MAGKRGLGRGLDSMIPRKTKESTATENKDHANGGSTGSDQASASQTGPEKLVKISKVEPNRNQPRKVFNEDALMELADSIKQYGVLQPLLVSAKDDYYEIIAGERRWRAAKMAGLKEIPVIIREYSNQEIVEISLIENIQREDLNAIEEARAYRNLIDEFGLTQDELADKVSKSRTAVTNSMRLLKLEEKVQQMLIDEMITPGHARTLLAVTDPEMQVSLAGKIFDEKLSVRETEQIVKNLTSTKPKKQTAVRQKNPAEDAAYEQIEDRIKTILGTKVQIQRKRNNKGKIEIEYYSREEFERIVDMIQSISYTV